MASYLRCYTIYKYPKAILIYKTEIIRKIPEPYEILRIEQEIPTRLSGECLNFLTNAVKI